MKEFTQVELSILNDVIKVREPSYLGAIQSLGSKSLSSEAKEKIQEALVDEMSEKGLEHDDEPNNYGKQIDEVLGKLEWY
jgi:hypothetical protein